MSQPSVIVLHGLARTARSMRRLAQAMGDGGLHPVNLDYPSRKHTIQELAQQLVPLVEQQVDREVALHLVSHSMGGLVGRVLMSLMPEYNWRNAVFIAPPHNGSHLARTLSSHPATQPFFHWFYGPAGLQVAEDKPELPLPPCPFGVIAGNKARALANPISWFSHAVLDQPSDGTVIVEETHLDMMVDFAEVAANHTTIMNQSDVHEMILHFFQHGRFSEVTDPT